MWYNGDGYLLLIPGPSHPAFDLFGSSWRDPFLSHLACGTDRKNRLDCIQGWRPPKREVSTVPQADAMGRRLTVKEYNRN
jgi:hypothetical protein